MLRIIAMEVDYRPIQHGPMERMKALRAELAELEHDHTYTVRRLFIAAAVIMLLLLPYVNQEISSFSSLVFVSLFSVLALVVAAGITSHRMPVTVMLDMGFSFVAMMVFEYFAVNVGGEYTLFFFINQTLAVIFLFAFYNSVKTLRFLWFDKNE